ALKPRALGRFVGTAAATGDAGRFLLFASKICDSASALALGRNPALALGTSSSAARTPARRRPEAGIVGIGLAGRAADRLRAGPAGQRRQRGGRREDKVHSRRPRALQRTPRPQ